MERRCTLFQMIKKKIFFLLLAILTIISSGLVSAEQVLWDDDSNIEIYDSWRDIDGTSMNEANCSYYLYNSDWTLNTSTNFIHENSGLVNFTIPRKEIGLYPFKLNCSIGVRNGQSTKDSIKIVDELPDGYKQRLVDINTTLQEINQTTHEIQDLLLNDINQTLTSLLNISEINLANLSTQMDEVLAQVVLNYDLLVLKWGNEDADELVNRLKDINRDIKNLNFRLEFISDDTLKTTLLSIKEDSRDLLDKVYSDENTKNDWLKWAIPVGFVLIIIFIAAIVSGRKNAKRTR